MSLKPFGFSFLLLFQKFLLFFIVKTIFFENLYLFFFKFFLEPSNLLVILFNFLFSLFSCQFAACMLFSCFFDKLIFLAGGKIFPVISGHSTDLLYIKFGIFLVDFFISHFVISDISTDGFLLFCQLVILFLELFALAIPYFECFLEVLFFLGR